MALNQTPGRGPRPVLGHEDDEESDDETASRPLSRALQKVLVFRFLGPGPQGLGRPPEVSLACQEALPGPPEASRRPPGPKTNHSKKPYKPKTMD